MYEQYYHFAEKPFRLTADPKYLYESQSHTNAVTLLREAIARREGFAVVTGDVGTGKTTLCRALLDQADRKTFTALLQNPFVSEEDLLGNILRDFGVVSRIDERLGAAGPSRQALIETLSNFLESLVSLGATALLIVDEAQAQPVPTLEQIRALSNLAADKVTLLQIVLVGQLDLLALLRTPQHLLLDGRFSIRCQLTPLTADETAAYVAHRLTVAGGAPVVTFTPSALQLVHEYSGGIPRLINMICHRALVAGYVAQTMRIDADLARAVADVLTLGTGQAKRPVEGRTWFSRLRRAPRS